MKTLVNNIFGIVILLMIFSCNGKSGKGNYNYDLPRNNSYASRFRLLSAENYTILEIIDPWQGAENVRQTWYLVPEDEYGSFTAPDEGTVLSIPLKRIVCMSATHVAMVAALGRDDVICAVSGSGLVYNSGLRESIRLGAVRDVGFDEGLNRELLVELAPDIIFAYGIGSESVAYQSKLTELGMKVLYNAEYLETEPLGKAEWIKVFGALFNCSEKADSLFREAETEYNSLKEDVILKGNTRPLVLLGLPWNEAWYISPGNSYMSKLINDAGGDYLWKKTTSNISMPYNLENVYLNAVRADFWINPGSANSIADIEATDYRLKTLGAVIRGNVYNNNKRMTLSGANDYWETGCIRPGLILRDLAKIFDNSMFPDDSLYFYKELK
jgi:iron complex transport system substrate-binding protein